MWYVIQTKTGEETRVAELINSISDTTRREKCFIPLYEEVRRSAGKCIIYIRRLFPGYIFADTEEPDSLFRLLRKVPEFTRLLGTDEEDGTKDFIPVGHDDEVFFRTLFMDGILHVSFISMKKSRIDRVIGPLAEYSGNITKLDIPHRRAIVETEVFGKKRKIRFGLWTENDPENAWLKQQMDAGRIGAIAIKEYDIGIHEGDMVTDATGIYKENEFKVLRVDAGRRLLYTETEMFGTMVKVMLSADNVAKI